MSFVPDLNYILGIIMANNKAKLLNVTAQHRAPLKRLGEDTKSKHWSRASMARQLFFFIILIYIYIYIYIYI